VVEDQEQVLQQAPGTDISNFPLHRLKQRPSGIPVDVSCTPDHRTGEAVLSYTGGGKNQKRKPSPKTWQLDLDEGRYTFQAQVANPKKQGLVSDEAIRPPYRNIRIKV